MNSVINDALAEIRAIALTRGDSAIELLVRADGRVSIRGVDPVGFTAWRVEADLEDGSAEPRPNSALAGVP